MREILLRLVGRFLGLLLNAICLRRFCIIDQYLRHSSNRNAGIGSWSINAVHDDSFVSMCCRITNCW